MTPNRTRLFLGLSVGFAGLLFAAGVVARNHHRGVVRLLAASPGSRTLSCSLSNGEDRPGSLYIPRAAPERPLSLVVAFHGTNATGASMIELLREEADKRHFVIVAPDSGYVEDVSAYTWRVGGHPGDTSPDTPHIEACLNDVATHLGARLSSSGWLALGHSGGASSAPFLATHDPRFSAFAVLHGGIFEGGLGRGVPRGWFSTGKDDRLRTPAHVSAQADKARGALGSEIVFRVFPGGHDVSAKELEEVFAFWTE